MSNSFRSDVDDKNCDPDTDDGSSNESREQVVEGKIIKKKVSENTHTDNSQDGPNDLNSTETKQDYEDKTEVPRPHSMFYDDFENDDEDPRYNQYDSEPPTPDDVRRLLRRFNIRIQSK